MRACAPRWQGEDADWTTLKPQIFEQIMDFYSAGEPLFSEGNEHKDSLEINDDDSEVVQMIKELLELRIRPSVQEDGGDISYRSECFGRTSGSFHAKTLVEGGLELNLGRFRAI